MSVRTPLELLLAQYDTSYEHLQKILKNLSDAEYFWEPSQPCWSIRPKADNKTPHAFGNGDWVLEFDREPKQPAPITTIAWRLCHLVHGQSLRSNYTFGDKNLTLHEFDFPTTAETAISFLEASHKTWREGLDNLNDADLNIVGLSTMPWGFDPNLPFADILWWTNRELIHHSSEIGLLRKLYFFQNNFHN